MFVLWLCDSLLCAHKSWGIKLHSLTDGQPFHSCLCVASGGALIMGGGAHCPESAMGLAVRALSSEPAVRHHVAGDPAVRILVVNAERSTAKCRQAGEQFPHVVRDRRPLPLVKGLETPWTICDLEDVVQDRPNRRRVPELEACKLRDSRGIYGQRGDDLHFRRDVAIAAGDELIKAVRRAAISWYAGDLADGSVLLVLAAGWNTNGAQYSAYDSDGHAWRKAELVALAELCALNGHPMSVIRAKMEELTRRAHQDHWYFLSRRAEDIVAIPPGTACNQKRSSGSLDSPRAGAGHLEGWLHRADGASSPPKRQRVDDAPSDAAKLAEAVQLPLDTAEGILQSAGSLAAALALPMFCSRRQPPPPPFGSTLRACAEVIDIDEADEEEEAPARRRDSDADDAGALSELVQMGFGREAARAALCRSAGSVARAIDELLQ